MSSLVAASVRAGKKLFDKSVDSGQWIVDRTESLITSS